MNLIASDHNRSRLGRVRGLAVGLVALGLVAGCSVAGASPTPTSMASASPSPMIAASIAPADVPPSLQPSAPTPAPSAATFTTPGVASNWTGLSWSQLPSDNPLVTADPGVQVLAWQHGYVVYGTTGGRESGFVWTSPDSETWTQATSIVAPQVLVAASAAGLVAVGSTVPTDTVWTSTDGVQWHDAGSPSGIGEVDSIAGTSAGFVATGHTQNGSGKFATQTFSVAFSTDGITWTPVAVQSGITWDDVGPQVQSGSNRFFVMGGYTDGAAETAAYRLDAFDAVGGVGGRDLVGSGAQGKGGLWWSDNGRTWTSTGEWVYATSLVFGRGGILAYESPRLIPGYIGLDVSTDNGKTWASAHDGPLGAVVCGQGECTEGPDGAFASNGTVIVALKSDGKTWISYDGKTWTSIAEIGPADNLGTFLVLPRGVIVGSSYGTAK